MRLIDADALKEKAYSLTVKNEWHMHTNIDVVDMEDIDNAPTIDAVPVVRCKNCDYWNELEKGVGVCKRLVEAMWVDYTDFCSFAENKDDITYGERENDE